MCERHTEVGVIILTKDRRDLLLRALASIAKQEYQGSIQVLIVGDECLYLASPLFESLLPHQHLRWLNITGDFYKGASTLKRIASLRNLALSQIKSRLITFLDDDNQWEPDHLSSLCAVMAETGCPAVHSWRVLVDDKNERVLVDSFPWLQDKTQAKRRFEVMIELGLMSDSSPVVRDRYEAIYNQIDYGMVDCGEWLFNRSLLKRLEFQTEYSAADEVSMVGEDDKLLVDLKKDLVPVACTLKPTLLYTLGGMSNRYIKRVGG